jgi:hypothetical protein
MATMFISYRRDDSAGTAGRVHDRLTQEFGDSLVFMDVDNIPLGLDFAKVLRDAVSKCDVLLAVIGKHWLDARNADGSRRLDNESDFVRIEIATALKRDIPIIPITVDGGEIPKAGELPEDLKDLATRNGLDVRHSSFRADTDRLISGLKKQFGEATATSTAWAAKLERMSLASLRMELRKSNEVYVLQSNTWGGVTVDGIKVSDSFQNHCIFKFNNERFELLQEYGFLRRKCVKLLVNHTVIFEWK